MTDHDPVNEKILRELSRDGRLSNLLLAERVGLSPSACLRRVQELERRGVIAGYAVRRGRNLTENLIRAHVMISGDPRQGERIVAELKKLPEVRALSAVSGTYDMIALIEAETTGRIDAVLDRIGKTQGVARTMSSIILSVKFER
mgnify:CR=1 FL=1